MTTTQIEADEEVILVGHQENGFHLGRELPVHMGKLKLIFEVGHGPQAANDKLRAPTSHVVHQQSAEGIDIHPAFVFQGLADLPRAMPSL